jgi:hypothetical protein
MHFKTLEAKTLGLNAHPQPNQEDLMSVMSLGSLSEMRRATSSLLKIRMASSEIKMGD